MFLDDSLGVEIHEDVKVAENPPWLGSNNGGKPSHGWQWKLPIFQ